MTKDNEFTDEEERSDVATYYTREVYGNELRYPVNGVAVMACKLARHETMTDHTVGVLESYGILIKEVMRQRPGTTKGETGE